MQEQIQIPINRQHLVLKRKLKTQLKDFLERNHNDLNDYINFLERQKNEYGILGNKEINDLHSSIGGLQTLHNGKDINQNIDYYINCFINIDNLTNQKFMKELLEFVSDKQPYIDYRNDILLLEKKISTLENKVSTLEKLAVENDDISNGELKKEIIENRRHIIKNEDILLAQNPYIERIE